MGIIKKAFLNSFANFFDLFIRQLMTFIINPFIIGNLGADIYGIWKMIGQTTNYSNLADIQTNQTLMWTISKEREVLPEDEMRRKFSSGFFVSIAILPVYIIVGAIITYFIPDIVKVTDEFVFIVRATTSIVILNFILNKIFTLFDSVLKGMNLGYKRLGLKAGISLINTGLIYIALKQGTGMVGLAISNTITIALTVITILFIIKKNVSWFGITKPSLSDMKEYFTLTVSFFLLSIFKLIVTSSDLIIIGFFLEPKIVTIYVTTRFMCNFVKSVVNTLIQGSKPSFSGYIGQKKFDTAAKIREQIFDLMWIISLSMALAILIVNKSFVGIWVSSDLFAGDLDNILIVLSFIFSIFLYNDEGYIKSSLNLKSLKRWIAYTSGISLLTSIILIQFYGLAGFLIGQILGHLILLYAYPKILISIFGKLFRLGISKYLRVIISLVLVVVITILLPPISLDSYIEIILAVSACFTLSGLLVFLIFLKKQERANIIQLVTKLKKQFL